MQKMVRTGFRGERKENPLPVHILSYSETSPKERGNVGTEKGEETSPLPPLKGECSDGKVMRVTQAGARSWHDGRVETLPKFFI